MSEENEKQEQTTVEPEGNRQEGTPDVGVKDSHGQEGIAKGKYQRDIASKDAEIEALKKELEQVKGEAAGNADANEEIKKLRAEIADEKLTNSLNAAGCVNAKAAKALLEDYDNDIDALAKDCPYLFKKKVTGVTGGVPTDAIGKADAVKKARAAAGLKDKE